ncbi:MAG: hypothetical protein GC145_06935 [Caulobacter sp.]|nr:hypothetical protein [Caulobacter sp.]
MHSLESRIAGWVAEAAPPSCDDAFSAAVIIAAERQMYLAALARRTALTVATAFLLGLLLTIARQQDFTAMTSGPLPVAALLVGAILLKGLFGSVARSPGVSMA